MNKESPAWTLILERLKTAGVALAIHEFKIIGVSDNSIGTRLPEMAKKGMVEGRVRKGENFKEWFIPGPGLQARPVDARAGNTESPVPVKWEGGQGAFL